LEVLSAFDVFDKAFVDITKMRGEFVGSGNFGGGGFGKKTRM
jgi:hypothetical protein